MDEEPTEGQQISCKEQTKQGQSVAPVNFLVVVSKSQKPTEKTK
jgi:hypothetical protein